MVFLFVCNINFNTNGPSVHLLKSLINSAAELGHSVYVISKSSKEVADDILHSGQIRFQYIKEGRNSKNFLVRYFGEILYAKNIAKLIKKRKYDAIFLQSTNAAWFTVKQLKRLSTPIVFNVQDIFPNNLFYSGLLPWGCILFKLFSHLQMRAYESVDRIITVSPDMKKTLELCGVERNKIICIYNWSYSDNQILRNNCKTFEYILNANKFNVLYAGNIGIMQNIEELVKVAQLLNYDEDIEFYIIGKGVKRNDIIKRCKNYENVHFIDFVSPEYIESVYEQADVNLIPLHSGVIRTALPSKTATCLRTQKNILFCIDKNSEFESELKNVEGVKFTSPDCFDIAEALTELKNSNSSGFNRTRFIKAKMSSIKNPRRYIYELEKVAEQNKMQLGSKN